MRPGSPLYWVLVVGGLGLLVGLKALRDESLRRRGYWMKNRNDLFVPLVAILILAAVALPLIVARRPAPAAPAAPRTPPAESVRTAQ